MWTQPKRVSNISEIQFKLHYKPIFSELSVLSYHYMT